jgi:O-antigen ligase
MHQRETTRTLVLPGLPAGWKTSPRLRELLVWAAVAVLGFVGGTSVVNDPHRAKLLLLLPFLALALTVNPEKIFIAWLFAAPLVQGASSGTNYGHSIFRLVFLVPPLILVARMAMGSVRIRGFWAIDALPALYLAYILVSVRLLPTEFTFAKLATVTSVYNSVGVGVAAYYITAFSKTSRQLPEKIAASILWGGVVVAVLAVVDGLTGWNLWHQKVAEADIHRAVSTFPSPFELGAYLGVAVAFALAILLFRGPRSLRLPSALLLVLAIPAFYVTYTRGPVLAIVAVGVLMALIARRARWPSILAVAAVAVLLFASWGRLTSSTLYKDRLGVSTVTPRVVMTDVALDLFKKRPVFGQGYATFDQVKLTLPIAPKDLYIVQTTTSHNTFLTVLAESGVVGLALLALPWLVIGWRAVAAGRSRRAEPWIVGACVGAAAVYAIGATTYDSRFFPLLSALLWVALGLARKGVALGWTRAEPASG